MPRGREDDLGPEPGSDDPVHEHLPEHATVKRIVRKVFLGLAFGGYAWLTLYYIEEGGAAMWISLAAWPFALTYGWLMGGAHKRNHAQRVALVRRVEPLVGYPPFVDMNDPEREEFLEALGHGAGFETLPAKWQSAIREAERNRPPGWEALPAPPPRPDPPPPDPAPVLSRPAPVEPFFGEVSEEARRFWSKPHPQLLHATPYAVVVLVSTTGIVGGVLLYEELGALVMLATIVGSLLLATVIAVWLSRRYEIPLTLPPRPPPDPRNAPDHASFRLRVPPLLFLLVLPFVYSVLIPVLVLDGPDPTIKAEDAPVWLASAGIVLVLVVAASVRMFRMRIEIDGDGLSVINFWKTRVIPWDSVRAIRMGVPRWAGPAFDALAVGASAAGTRGPGDAPSGLRILYSHGELAVSDSITVSATLGCDPRRHPRYQEALATLVKQVHAHATSLRRSTDRPWDPPAADAVSRRGTFARAARAGG